MRHASCQRQKPLKTPKKFAVWFGLFHSERNLFRKEFDADPIEIAHEAWVRSGFPADRPYDPINSLKHHLRLISQFGSMKEEQARTKAMIRIGKQKIRRTNCVETELFRHHFRFVFPKKSYSEFGAIVLISADRKFLRVHFITEATNNGSVIMSKMESEIQKDLSKGYRRWLHLHSHPFDFSNEYGDFGPIGPSGPDLQAYIGSDYPFAVVTDGIHSFEMDRATYQAIAAAGK